MRHLRYLAMLVFLLIAILRTAHDSGARRF